ncbi:MAG: Spy/CpxP family protein refolding chaperone [Rhodanobacter sp.]
MNKTIRNVAVPALFVFASLGTSVWAQTATAPAASSSIGMAMSHHAQKRADVVEQRISDLHGKLMITDQQSKPWDAFAQTMRDNASKTRDAFRDRSQKLPSMNADDSMKSYAALVEQHAENMRKLSSAMSDLYAVLSPEQKQTADAMYRNQQPKRHHGSHKHGKSSAPASAASAG